MNAEALQRDGLLEALLERGGGAGVRALQLAGEPAEALEGGGVVGELPGRPQSPLDGRAVALGQVVEDVAFSLMSFVLSRFVLVVGPLPLAGERVR